MTACKSPSRVSGCEEDCGNGSCDSFGCDVVSTTVATFPSAVDDRQTDDNEDDNTDSAQAAVKQQQQHMQQQQQLKQKKFAALSKSCDNSPVPAMSASRRKSFKDNMESLVRRLECELADGDPDAGTETSPAAKCQPCRTLSRANGTQTMPVGGLRRGDGRDIAPFTFRRVYVVDEPPPSEQHQHRPRAPSTSSTPNSSSADTSSASDCSSDTVSEFSIDSSSDRSSIISLEDSLDHHVSSSSASSSSSSFSLAWCRNPPTANMLQHQALRLGKMSTSCFNVWETPVAGCGGKRKWPKECSGAVARAMSQFANGCGGGDCAKTAARLRVFDDKTNSGGDSFATARDRRSVGLELMRERNGNVVVIREIKTNSGSRYARCSEVKCESVQSRIRKLQVHRHSEGSVQIDKSSNIF